MDYISGITSGPYFSWVVLPILIFCSRIMDVSVGTLRIIFVARGKKTAAPILGFFEVLIWLVVITGIMKYADSWICYIAYAAGYATGNYVGMMLEEKLAIGILSVRIFASDDKAELLTQTLSDKGYGVTQIKGSGKHTDTNILHCIIRRKEYSDVVSVINGIDGSLFYYAEELRHVSNGIFQNNDCKK